MGRDRDDTRSRDGAVARLRKSLRVSGLRWTASLALDRAGVPAMRLWRQRNITPTTLSRQVAMILGSWGMSEPHVAITTDYLMYADLRGIDSHGCAMMRDYHRGLRAGRLTMTPSISVIREDATTALIDGGGGLGHVPGDVAMKLAIRKCLDSGLGAVAVRNSGHFGAAGAYAARAAKSGCIGIAMTSVRTPSVVPTNGVEAKLGTNPIAFAATTKQIDQPFLLDMATSTAPLGKLMTAWRSGRAIPAGWALDERGQPDTNPRRAAQARRLTPLGSSIEMGSHKGYGLATMVEILSSVLPGVRDANNAAGAEPRVGHFFLALDPRRFRDDGAFEAGLSALTDDLRATTPINPAQPVLVAGDPEHATCEARTRSGIPLSRGVIEDLRAVCDESRAPFLLDSGDEGSPIA